MAKIGLSNAEVALQQARAEHVQAQINAERSRITAPFDAWVLERHVELGETIVSELNSKPILAIAEFGKMRVHAGISESELSEYTIGKMVTVTVGSNNYSGRVVSVGLELSQLYASSGSKSKYPVWVEFDTAGKLLRAGQKAEIDLK